MAKVISRNLASGKSKDDVHFNLIVQNVFKSSPKSRLTAHQKRTPITLSVPIKNMDCRCPNIRMNK
jgi:hypothetical protein